MPMLHQDQRSRPEESNFLSEDKHRFCRAGKHSCEKGGYEPIPNLNGPAHLKKQQQQQHQQQQQQYLEEQQQQQQHQENSKEEEEDKLISRALGQVTVGVDPAVVTAVGSPPLIVPSSPRGVDEYQKQVVNHNHPNSQYQKQPNLPEGRPPVAKRRFKNLVKKVIRKDDGSNPARANNAPSI